MRRRPLPNPACRASSSSAAVDLLAALGAVLAAPAAVSQELLYAAEGNRLHRYRPSRSNSAMRRAARGELRPLPPPAPPAPAQQDSSGRLLALLLALLVLLVAGRLSRS